MYNVMLGCYIIEIFDLIGEAFWIIKKLDKVLEAESIFAISPNTLDDHFLT